MKEIRFSHYGPSTYSSELIPAMPAPPKKRERVGEELLPFGDYAGIAPYQQLCEDAELIQQRDQEDPNFNQSDSWWWDHQRIRFIKSKLGLSILLMVFPFVYFCILVSIPYFIGGVFMDLMYDYSSMLATLVFLAVAGGADRCNCNGGIYNAACF